MRAGTTPGGCAMELDLGPEIERFRAELRDWIDA
jgi:hypothetical protein